MAMIGASHLDLSIPSSLTHLVCSPFVQRLGTPATAIAPTALDAASTQPTPLLKLYDLQPCFGFPKFTTDSHTRQ